MIRVLSFLCLIASTCGILPAEQKPSRPNILFAVADDWGAHAGIYGTKWVKTPAFDRVAREGVLFHHAYTPMAKCGPSRAIILTGRHLWQLEEAGNHLAVFPPKFKSWPEVLIDHGWHVGITGKGWAPGLANDAKGRPRLITGKPFNQRQTKSPTKHLSSIDYAANFTDFLDAAPKDGPWCFWYGSLEPHRSYEFQSGQLKGGKQLSEIDRVPGYWPDHETVRHDMLDYAFEVEHADSHLNLMLEELERRKMLDNTIVIVTGDHGMPFPRVKGHANPHANQVPLAIRWPAGIPHAGRRIDDFVDFTDIAPTILDVADIDLGKSGMMPFTGASWMPILKSRVSGQVIKDRDHVLLGKERTDVGRPGTVGYPVRGIIRGGFLYLHNYEPTRWPAGNPETGYLDTDGSPTKSLILELGRKNRSDAFWQLNFGLHTSEELYDLGKDGDCMNDLAADPTYAERLKDMREFMEEKLKAQGDPRMKGAGDVFDTYKPVKGYGFYEARIRGEKPEANWVSPEDFENEPVLQEMNPKK